MIKCLACHYDQNAAISSLIESITDCRVEPLGGRRNFKAVIDGVEDGILRITDIDGESFTVRLDNIDKAKLEIIF